MTITAPSADRSPLGSLTPRTARLTAGAAILAPVLLLTSTLVFVLAENGINNGVTGGVISLWSCIVFIAAFAGIYRMLEPDRPRTAWWLTAVAGAAFIGGAAFSLGAVYEATLGTDTVLSVQDTHPFSLLAYVPWGWCAPLTFILAGAFLWRTGVVPWWNGSLIILGGILFVTGRPARIDAIAIATDIVLILGLGALALRLLRSAGHTAERRASRHQPDPAPVQGE